MSRIIRDPAGAAGEKYDLIIIGGGIYGVMLSLEASKRGLRALLLEQDDFGSHTSFNSLRIIHGGLRYLQGLDIRRFRESVRERHWFLRNFPSIVQPLPFLMPLYGNGLRRPVLFQVALRVNDLLSWQRDQDLHPNCRIPTGQIVDARKTRQIFPSCDRQGLQGGAIWYDACMPDSQRLLIGILRWACEFGATVLNYIEARQLLLLKNKHSVAGVVAIDHRSGRTYEYKAEVVVNATGPWCRDLAARFDRDESRLFKASLAWNALLDRDCLSSHGLALTVKKSAGRTYFLLPWKGKVLAGTGHAPWLGRADKPIPSVEQLEQFMYDLNILVPGLDVRSEDIVRVFSGLLPVTEVGSVSLSVRPTVFDHGRYGGPHGLYSVSGVKFTTARLVAEQVLNQIYPHGKTLTDAGGKNFRPPYDAQNRRGLFFSDWHPLLKDPNLKDVLQRIIVEEAVEHLDDLVLRRSDLWENRTRVMDMAPFICGLFHWNDVRCREEMERLEKELYPANSC